jgi:hypothetical protein
MAMQLPPLNLNTASSAKGGELFTTFGARESAFNVNYGSGGIGGAVPWWVWAGGLALGYLWLKKRSA